MNDLKRRFWAKVQITPACWEWQAGRNAAGYGRLRLAGGGASHAYAHRVSYEIHHGPVPEGLLVRHRCDNPPCVNPDHLEVGTTADNMTDKAQRGRCNPPIGQRNPRARLSPEAVLEIRRSAAPLKELADAYGVSESAISQVRRRRSWAWV